MIGFHSSFRPLSRCCGNNKNTRYLLFTRPGSSTIRQLCLRHHIYYSPVISTPICFQYNFPSSGTQRRRLSLAASDSQEESNNDDLFSDTLIITNACADRIHSLRKSYGDDNLRLRVSVEGGGCSGFQYSYHMIGSKDDNENDAVDPEEDIIFEKNGAEIVVDKGSFEFIKGCDGSTLEFEQELIRSSFAIINNPQSASACGCGSSFALKNFAANPALD